MKFVLVNWSFSHESGLGGCESFYEKLASTLRQSGHTVDFVSSKKAASELNVPIRPNLSAIEAALLIDKCLAKRYPQCEDDSIIVRDAGVGGFMRQSLPQVSVFGSPYFTLNDMLLARGEVDMLTYNLYHDIFTYFEKRTAEDSIRNVALSNFMAEVEMRSLGIHCHKVIDSGVDTEFFKPRAKDDLRIKYGLSADRTVACWVGGSHPIKGIGVVSELISRFPDIDWILVFRDLSGKDLAAPRIPATLTVTIHKRGIALTVHRRGMPASLACLKKTIHKDERRIFNKRRIIILGKLQPQQLNEIYCLSDFAVLPYLCEGSNYVVLEACSCNLPIVTTRTGLFWDFWDDRIGVPIDKSRDVKEYSNAISKLMNHIETFEPRKVVLEQELNLESWADTWVKYLTSVR